MHQWIILPYDGSPIARAALRRAAQAVRSDSGRYRGVLVATAGVEPAAIGALTRAAAAVAGPDVPLDVRLLHPGDPIAAFCELSDSLPDATLAAPLGVKGGATWYARACKPEGLPHAIMLFFIGPKEIAAFGREHPSQSRLPRLLGALRHARPRLRPQPALPFAQELRPAATAEMN